MIKLSDLMDHARDNRKDILTAEVGALLHDLGKMRNGYITGQTPVVELISPSMSEKFNHISEERLTRKVEGSLLKNDVVLRDLFENYNLAELVAFGRPYYYKNYEKLQENINCTYNSVVSELLGLCHGIAHIEKLDVKTNLSQSNKKDPVFQSSPFGNHYKREIDKHDDNDICGTPGDNCLNVERKYLNCRAYKYLFLINEMNENNIIKIYEARKSFFREVKHRMTKAVADTRIPINDVTLWDWGYLVASFFKPIHSYIGFRFKGISYNEDKEFDFMKEGFWSGYSVLRVNIDRLYLMEKAIKLSDIVYFNNAILNLYDSLCKLIEVDASVGNEIYRDERGIYFLLPGNIILNDKALKDLKGCISDKLILNNTEFILQNIKDTNEVHENGNHDAFEIRQAKKNVLENALSGCFVDLLCEGNKAAKKPQPIEIGTDEANTEGPLACPVCRIRRKEDDICSVCKENRNNVNKEKNSKSTIWSGEIADKNRNLATVSLIIDPSFIVSEFARNSIKVKTQNDNMESKNITATRTMRMRNNIADFIDNTLNVIIKIFENDYCEDSIRNKRILLKHKGEEESITIENKYNKKISLEKIDSKNYSTTDNLARYFRENFKGRELGSELQSWHVNNSSIRNNIIIDEYLPFREVYKDQISLTLMMPADFTPLFVSKFQEEYIYEFRQVQNRVPLHIAAVYMRDKMPVGAALEALNNWRKNRVLTAKATVRDNNKCVEYKDTYLSDNSNANTGKEIIIESDYGEESIVMAGKILRTSGSVEDEFYPYWDTGNQNNGTKEWIHINNLDKNQTINYTPSLFTFMNMDSPSQRFDDSGFKNNTILLSDFAHIYNNFKDMFKTKGFAQKVMTAYHLIESKKKDFEHTNVDIENDEIFKKLYSNVLKREGIDIGVRYKHFVHIHNMYIKTLKLRS